MTEATKDQLFFAELINGKTIIGEVVNMQPLKLKNIIMVHIQITKDGVGYAMIPYLPMMPTVQAAPVDICIVYDDISDELLSRYNEEVRRYTSKVAIPDKKILIAGA